MPKADKFTSLRENIQPLPPEAPARAPGKSKNPEFKAHTFYLRKATQRKIAAILAEQEDGPDFSELVQSLLDDWLAKQLASQKSDRLNV